MARVGRRVLAIVEAAWTGDRGGVEAASTWALTPDGYACIRGAYLLNFFLTTHSLVFSQSLVASVFKNNHYRKYIV